MLPVPVIELGHNNTGSQRRRNLALKGLRSSPVRPPQLYVLSDAACAVRHGRCHAAPPTRTVSQGQGNTCRTESLHSGSAGFCDVGARLVPSAELDAARALTPTVPSSGIERIHNLQHVLIDSRHSTFSACPDCRSPVHYSVKLIAGNLLQLTGELPLQQWTPWS